MITLSNADTIRLIKTLSTLTAVRPNSVREYEVWRQNYLLLQKLRRKYETDKDRCGSEGNGSTGRKG